MWIIPKNFSGTYPSVQGTQELGLDSNEFCQLCEKSLMWKSKATQSKTWLTRWNKDTYLQHLSTQTLKPSRSQTFVDAWTSYLAAFPASPLAKPGREEAPKTHGISSPTLPMESTPVQQDMFSLRMSKESSPPKRLTGRVFSDMSSENWNSYIIQRRSEYSVRQKQAQAIRESEYLSLLQEMESRSMTYSPDTQSQNPPSGQQDPTNNSLNGKNQESSNWLTPRVLEVDESYENYQQRMVNSKNPKNIGKKRPSNLTMQVKLQDNWPTPRASNPGSRPNGKGGKILAEEVRKQESSNWPTPAARDHKGTNSPEKTLARVDAGLRGHTGQLPNAVMVNEIKNWATPKARDHLGAVNPNFLIRKDGRHRMDALPEQTKYDPTSYTNWPTAAEGSKIGLSNHPSIVGSVTREKEIKSGKEKNWPTPNVSDIYSANVPHDIGRNYLRSEVLDDYKKSSGKLNPSWVEQLMGLPVQWSMLPEPTSAHRVSRLMLLGNGVVPQQAEVAFRTLLAQADLNRQS
jgi:hypothetical protein